jgi:toxin FitB
MSFGMAFRARAVNHAKAEEIAAGVDAILDAYAGRILPIGAEAAKVWAELLARQNKHVNDKCLVAIASVNGLILVARNVKHTANLGIDVLDPFTTPERLHKA